MAHLLQLGRPDATPRLPATAEAATPTPPPTVRDRIVLRTPGLAPNASGPHRSAIGTPSHADVRAQGCQRVAGAVPLHRRTSRALGTPPCQRGQPTRSAIAVAGMLGYAFSSSRTRGSTPSTSDPAGSRRYLGGPSLLNAALTVFLARPMTRAICEIDMASGRRKRRISAQSSTPNTRFLPCSVQARVSGKLVNFQLPRADQYSVAVDSHSQHPTTPARMTPSRVHGPQHDHL